jgi:signal peptidase I
MALFKQVRGVFGFLLQVVAIVFLMKSFAFASNYIPSESMQPTLEVGDRLVISKWAYGYSRHSLAIDLHADVPTGDGRVLSSLPTRGDVVVFTHPQGSDTMIKRVIGLPGDRIALAHGRLYINGALVERRETAHYSYREYRGSVADVIRYDEYLPGGRTHAIIERSDNGFADTFSEVTVPENHLFMMGDNRDNSADSRFEDMGFVPVANLQGRAEAVMWSLYSCEPEDGLTCAGKRALTRIR